MTDASQNIKCLFGFHTYEEKWRGSAEIFIICTICRKSGITYSSSTFEVLEEDSRSFLVKMVSTKVVYRIIKLSGEKKRFDFPIYVP